MCLAKAFVNNWSGQPVFQDIARMRINGNRVELETLFGEEKVVPGIVIEIDFTASRILVEKHCTIDAEN
ncbi:CooT family nickel-binding protein [Chloroflexota bacterium]|jgi:predicted RNA-binding protein